MKDYFNENIKYGFFFNNISIPNIIDKIEDIRKIWEKFETETDFPVLQFDSELINSSFFDLYKYEKILSSFQDEKFEIKKVLTADYAENLENIPENLNPEDKDINKYLTQENQEIFVQINQAEKPQKNIPSNMNNILNCFSSKVSEKNNNSETFLNEFEKNLSIYNQKSIEDIFPPNKPTLYAPSTKGTKLYLSGLLNFLITKGQENKIWLEKKDRLKKDYRVCVVIDSSRSCFNKDSFYYSFSVVKILLEIIFYSRIPYFDLIIATNKNPVVICSGQDSSILNNTSFIWSSIISYIYGERSDDISCNLYDAIYLAIQIKLQQTSKKYFCFVLTDGIFNNNYKNELKNICSFCEYSQINIYGIGLGLYPEGLSSIFSKCLWSPDINYFIQALSAMIKEERVFSSNFDIKLDNYFKRNNINNDMMKYIKEINENHMKYCTNKRLYEFLDGRKVYKESLQEVIKIDPLFKDASFMKFENNENISMFKEGFFRNFKILIRCFWSKSISSKKKR